MLALPLVIVSTSVYHVATTGSDSAAGSSAAPFRTIQHCADEVKPGDTCCIHSGTYNEAVTVSGKAGTSSAPVTFESCGAGRVALDGTIAISSTWTVHSGSIWKTTISTPVWQLFVGYGTELVMARWPNARFSDGSVFDKEAHWAHGTIDADSNAYSNGELIDEPHGDIDLSASGVDATGAIAILNVGSFKTWSRVVNSHSGNRITYDPVPSSGWRTKHHDFFLEGKLSLLDAPGEWWLDTATNELYLWAPGDADPNTLEIRGKTISYAFDVSGSDHVILHGLEFFSSTFRFSRCNGCLAEGLNLVYPSTSKRMLREIGTTPETSIFTDRSVNGTVRRCAFRYTDGSALEMYSHGMLVEESYFFHIDWTATDGNGLMTTMQLGGRGNVVRRNTMHRLGTSSAINPGDAALIEYNDISDTGHLQSDGALSHMMVGQQPGAEVRYNWLHDTIKYGARFDGNGDGNNGLMHHNVIWNCGKGLMIKGYEHRVYHNTAFDNTNGLRRGNDLLIMIEQGGNAGTETISNAANCISGHRTGSYEDNPVPGTYRANWNGYETGSDVKDQLIDPFGTSGVRDFRPKEGSELIDAGQVVPGVSDSYIGSAPDAGAYEAGGERWVPGVTWDVSAVNVTFIPPERDTAPRPPPPPPSPPSPPPRARAVRTTASSGGGGGLALGLSIGGGVVGGLALLAAGCYWMKKRGKVAAYEQRTKPKLAPEAVAG